jgi:hypothetical protein
MPELLMCMSCLMSSPVANFFPLVPELIQPSGKCQWVGSKIGCFVGGGISDYIVCFVTFIEAFVGEVFCVTFVNFVCALADPLSPVLVSRLHPVYLDGSTAR